jgi:large subunit ribosomal protein L31
MKKDIHPTYYPDAQVICACGNTWTTGSTMKVIRTDVCSNCHPFYTGEQRIVDTEGQVDRFYKKLQARQEYLDEQEARRAARTSPERPIEELGLGTRATDSLTKAGITIVGDALEKLAEGEAALLAVDGFGRKSLADLKKRLRQFGYELPEAADEIVV